MRIVCDWCDRELTERDKKCPGCGNVVFVYLEDGEDNK